MLPWIVWGILGLVMVSIFVAFVLERQTQSRSRLPVLGRISDFNLTNQMGNPVTLSNLAGNVVVVNVIFTRCAGPCPKLTRQMRQVHDLVSTNLAVRFISLTADPAHDTPGVLREYGRRFPADPARWFYLTGAKSELYRLAIDDFKFTVLDNQEKRQPDEDIFIHSMKFVILDSAARVRAYVDGDEPETVTRIMSAVSALMKEMNR